MRMDYGQCYVKNENRNNSYIWVTSCLGLYGQSATHGEYGPAPFPYTLNNGGGNSQDPMAACNSEIGDVKAGGNPGYAIYQKGWCSHGNVPTVYDTTYTGRPGITYT